MTYQEVYEQIMGEKYPYFPTYGQEYDCINKLKNNCVRYFFYEEASVLRGREKEIELKLGIKTIKKPILHVLSPEERLGILNNISETDRLKKNYYNRNFLSVDKKVAINSYGEYFIIGQEVIHEDKVLGDETAIITSFSLNEEYNEVKVHTNKGYIHIDFISSIDETKINTFGFS